MSETVLESSVLRELQETLGGDRAVIEELVEAFIDDAADLVDLAMRSAIGDTTTFRRSIHSLKTTSATFGASKLSSICLRLETTARDAAPVVVDDLDALVAAHQEATAALRELFSGE